MIEKTCLRSFRVVWQLLDRGNLIFRFISALYNSKNFLFRLWGSWYSKRPAWAHGFNAKIGFEKYAPGPEILTKTSQNMKVWFGYLNFGTNCLISLDPVHIFQNRFLRWNRELKPIVLSTINPMIRRIFFFELWRGLSTLKGASTGTSHIDRALILFAINKYN